MKKSILLFAVLFLGVSASIFAQPFYMRGELNGWAVDPAYELTDANLDGIFDLSKDLGVAPGVGRKEFKIYNQATDSWYPGGSNAWFVHKGGSVIFRFNTATSIVEAKDAALTVCAPGAFSNWDNNTAMTKTGNIYCYTVPTPGEYEWKPTYCGTWDSWQPCSGERSTNSGNWFVKTTTANEQVCLTYNPTTGRATQNAKLTLVTKVVSNICVGGTTGTAKVTATGSPSPYSYMWSNQATTDSIGGLAAGTYTVTVTSPGFCPTVKTVTVTQPTSGVTFTYAITQTSPTRYKVVLTPSGGTAPYKYQKCTSAGVCTVFGTNPTYLNLVAGTYTFSVKDKKGCISTQTVQVPAANGNAQADDRGGFAGYSLAVSPNPASDFLHVQISGVENNGTFAVSDLLGRTVLEQKITNAADANLDLSLAGFKPGTYCLTFRGNNGTLVSKRFVVAAN